MGNNNKNSANNTTDQHKGIADDHIAKASRVLDMVDRLKKMKWAVLLDASFKILFLVCFVCVIRFVVNPKPTIEYIVNMGKKYIDDSHSVLIQKRMTNTPLINKELALMLSDMHAERTFVIEFHNGNNNMANLPFWWGDMTYEYVNTECAYSVRDSWLNISLTRYKFFAEMCNTNYWIGTVTQVKDIDEGFYRKLNVDNIEYIAFIMLYNIDGNPLGVVGATLKEVDVKLMGKDALVKNLLKYGQIINPLLLGT